MNLLLAGFVGTPAINLFDGVVENATLTLQGTEDSFSSSKVCSRGLRNFKGR